MTWEIALMLVVLAGGVVLFVRETVPLEVTALTILGVLLIAGIVTPQEAVTGFSNEAVVTIGALFALSHGLTLTGLITTAGCSTIPRSRMNPGIEPRV